MSDQPDIEAIRQRYEEAKSLFLRQADRDAATGGRTSVHFATIYPTAFEDIRSLLAELKRVVSHRESWIIVAEYWKEQTAKADAEIKRLQRPLRCSACGAPDEAHVYDGDNLWKIWLPDPVYPLWGTPHRKVMRREP